MELLNCAVSVFFSPGPSFWLIATMRHGRWRTASAHSRCGDACLHLKRPVDYFYGVPHSEPLLKHHRHVIFWHPQMLEPYQIWTFKSCWGKCRRLRFTTSGTRTRANGKPRGRLERSCCPKTWLNLLISPRVSWTDKYRQIQWMVEHHTFWRQWRDLFLLRFIHFFLPAKNRPAIPSCDWNSWGPLRVHLIQESTSDGEQTLLLVPEWIP